MLYSASVFLINARYLCVGCTEWRYCRRAFCCSGRSKPMTRPSTRVVSPTLSVPRLETSRCTYAVSQPPQQSLYTQYRSFLYSWLLTPTHLQLDMLREYKPPPIRRIRISDFGLPDPKRDPDRHQNCITWSLNHALPLQKISSKSVHKFASNPTDRQTNRQTDRTKNITSAVNRRK